MKKALKVLGNSCKELLRYYQKETNELKMFAKKQQFSTATRCLILDTAFGGCENKQIGEMIVIRSQCLRGRSRKGFPPGV